MDDLYIPIDIAVYEHDKQFANTLENYIRQTVHCPTALNTGSMGQIMLYIQQPHRPTLFLLDLMTDTMYQAGKVIAKQIEKYAKLDRYMFISSYPDEVRDDPSISCNAITTVYKDHPNFAEIFPDALERALLKTDAGTVIIGGAGQRITLHATDINYITTGRHNYILYSLSATCPFPAPTIERKGTLENIQKQLSPLHFRRVHRAYICNIRNALSFQNETILFRDESTCPYLTNKIPLKDIERWAMQTGRV